ncbi:MAG: transposase [Thermodesulfobacteriota bacterium]
MARPLRLEYPGAIYHITSRGNAREDIVLNNEDRKLFLSILAATVERYNWFCHSYCLMDNHYHLLIETPAPNLSRGMRQLNGVYTQAFNRSHKRVGHVFQGRYKSILVEGGAHLLELCRYIVLNPVKADMVKRPEDWPWSSYNAISGLSNATDFLSIGWILGQFSSKKKQARKRYIEFVNDGMQARDPWQQLQGQIFFGSSQFVARMRELLGEKKEVGEIPKEQRYPGRPPLPDLFGTINDKQDRNKKIAIAHLEHGYTLIEISVALGIHYTTVSKVVKRLA